MKKLAFIVSCYCLASCNGNSYESKPETSHDFFPVNTYLNSQVHLVDSLQPLIYKYTTVNHLRDSVLLSVSEFNELAKEFIQPDINATSLKKYYKETSFVDQSIPAVTFTYSTQNRELPVQRIDVIAKEESLLSEQVQSVYMEIINTRNDTTIGKKLYWKTNKSFQIISSLQTGNQPAVNSQVKVVWGTAGY